MPNTRLRVQQHRNRLREAGLRPIQIWVPDTRDPQLAKICQHQSLLVRAADAADKRLHQLQHAALDDIEGWTE